MTSDQTRQTQMTDAPARPHPVVPPLVADVIAAIMIVAAAFAPFPGNTASTSGWATLVLVIAPAVVLPFRRRWPVPALVVCVGLYVAASTIGVSSPGIGLGVAIAMFGVANRSSRRTTLIVAGVTVLAVFLLSIPIVSQSPFDPRVFQFVFAIVATSAAGDATRSRRAYIAAITERAERAERTREAEASRRVTEERLRLARDLHDAVAHQIAVISLNAGVASSALRADPDRAASALATIRGASRTVLKEIGGLLAVLRADEETAGALDPQPGLEQLPVLLEQFRASGLEVGTRIDPDAAQITGATGLVAYRVIQEALTNAHKHGPEHRAHLLVESGGDALRVVVTNPAGTAAGDGTGVGLIGLRERVASVGGTVEAGIVPGGWRLAASLPRSQEVTS